MTVSASALATLVLSGLRIGEALHLRWRDVQLANDRLVVCRSNTAAGERTIDLLPLVHDELVSGAGVPDVERVGSAGSGLRAAVAVALPAPGRLDRRVVGVGGPVGRRPAGDRTLPRGLERAAVRKPPSNARRRRSLTVRRNRHRSHLLRRCEQASGHCRRRRTRGFHCSSSKRAGVQRRRLLPMRWDTLDQRSGEVTTNALRLDVAYARARLVRPRCKPWIRREARSEMDPLTTAFVVPPPRAGAIGLATYVRSPWDRE